MVLPMIFGLLGVIVIGYVFRFVGLSVIKLFELFDNIPEGR